MFALNWHAIESKAVIYPGLSQESKGIHVDIKNIVEKTKWWILYSGKSLMSAICIL